MTVTVSAKNYSSIDNCEDYNTWAAGGGNPDDVIAFFKEGTQCVGFELWQSGNLDIYITGSWDLSGVKHLRCWMMLTCLNELNTDANGGVQYYVSDGTNTGYYYISGSTSYPGGWYNLVCDLSRAVDAGTKPTMGSVTTIGLRFNLTANAKKVQSLWIDHLYRGDGLIAYGDDAGGSFDFDDILAADENTSNGWGMIRKLSGIYYLVGSITLGDNASTNDCDFAETNQIIIFEDRKVNSALYEIFCVGNATGATSIAFGDKVGTTGISGCTIKSNSTNTPLKLTATDTNVDTLGLYGNTFDTHGVIDLMVNSTNREVLNCNFSNGQNQIQPNTMTFERNNVISNISTDGAVLFESTAHNMQYNNYISNNRATEFTTADTYAVTGDQFSDNTYDIHFSAASGNLIINCGGSPKANPSSVENDSSGTVTINNTVNISITTKDASDDSNITGALVYIRALDGTGDYPYQESVSIVSSGGTATVTHTGHGLQTDEYVRISGANEPEYNGVKQITVTGTDTYTYTITGSPSSPATGTPVSTFVLLFATSDGSGEATAVMRYKTLDQPFTGWARKSSGTPLYKTGILSGTVANADYSTTVYLVDDE